MPGTRVPQSTYGAMPRVGGGIGPSGIGGQVPRSVYGYYPGQ